VLLLGLLWWAAIELFPARDQPFEQPVRLEARIIRAPFPAHPKPDTINFAVPAVARRCPQGRAVLLEGAAESGNGLLALLRWPTPPLPPAPDSVAPPPPSPPPAGSFPMITYGDSLTPRGARVSVRYMMGDVAHGFALDSGAVELERTGAALSGRVRGASLENTIHVSLDARFHDVAFAADTGRCRWAP
jgi:hypothetical protein